MLSNLRIPPPPPTVDPLVTLEQLMAFVAWKTPEPDAPKDELARLATAKREWAAACEVFGGPEGKMHLSWALQWLRASPMLIGRMIA